MRLNRDVYVYAGVMVLMLVIIGRSLAMVYLSSKMLPLIISGTIFVLAAIQLSRVLLGGEGLKAVGDEEVTGGGEKKETWYGYLLVSIHILGFFLAIYLLNFIVSIPLFILAYMKTHHVSWRLTITIAVVTTAFIYLFFEVALELDLYQGLLFEALGY